MKFFKWKICIITMTVCLLPMLLGFAMWESLPDSIAIHFDINGNPDNFAPKAFAVAGIPVLMAVMQLFCCFISDINENKHGTSLKVIRITKWMFPVVTVILYFATIFYATGVDVDIRRVAVFIVGALFLVTGNYLPKFDYIRNYNVSAEKARKINRFVGYETVIMGVIMLISMFFPPIASVVSLILLIPYMIIAVIYGVIVGRK